MTKFALHIFGLIAWTGAAVAQTPDPAEVNGLMAGRNVRVHDGDRVVGEIRQVIEQDGGLAAVIDLTDPSRSVVVDLGGIQQQGGDYYLTVTPDQISALPDAAEDTAPSTR